jgi:hypothetical protein
MNLLIRIFGKPKQGTVSFRGQGYEEEGALFHANQRYHAWVKEKEKGGKHVLVEKKDITFQQKNDLIKVCKIAFSYKITSPKY